MNNRRLIQYSDIKVEFKREKKKSTPSENYAYFGIIWLSLASMFKSENRGFKKSTLNLNKFVRNNFWALILKNLL